MKRRVFLIASTATAATILDACASAPAAPGPASVSAGSNGALATREPDTFAFVGHTIVRQTIAGLSVEGVIKNTGNEPLTGILRADLVDVTGNVGGAARGVVNDVQPGVTKAFLLQSGDRPRSIAQVSLHVDTALPGRVLPKFVFLGVSVARSNDGPVVTGEITNPDAVAHSLTLVATFWDGTGQVVGMATGAINPLAAGETERFQLPITDDISNYRRVTVEVDALTK